MTLSWVLAQESYGYYYSGDLREALDTAQHAQGLVKYIPCVGAALAAALEARIHAMMGRQRETHEAVAHAEQLLSLLTGDDLIPSALVTMKPSYASMKATPTQSARNDASIPRARPGA